MLGGGSLMVIRFGFGERVWLLFEGCSCFLAYLGHCSISAFFFFCGRAVRCVLPLASGTWLPLEGVEPQLYAGNLKCVSRDPGVLLRAAGFTSGYVRVVGQERAPGKCVLMSTSWEVRKDMRDWTWADEGIDGL